MLEIEFEQAIVDIAHLYGWRVASFRPAGTGKGWRTPVKYDGKGYPDLTLIHPHGYVIFAEIKTNRGGTSPEQDSWALLLSACEIQIEEHTGRPEWPSTMRYFLWRPKDGDTIASVLSFGKVTSWTP